MSHTRTHTCRCTHIHTYVQTHILTRSCTHANTHIHAHTFVHTGTQTHVHTVMGLPLTEFYALGQASRVPDLFLQSTVIPIVELRNTKDVFKITWPVSDTA